MEDHPLLPRSETIRAPVDKREAVFRGIVGSEKYSKNYTGQTAPTAADIGDAVAEDTTDEEDEARAGTKGPDDAGLDPFWYMETHPRIMAHLLWGGKGDALSGVCVDFTPGPFSFAWAAANMWLKTVNQAHIELGQAHLTSRLRACIFDDDKVFTPASKERSFAEVKPPLLSAYEQQKKT